MFNDVSKARKRISGIINGFQKMVDDLNAGINVLSDAIKNNSEKINELTSENCQYENEIFFASTVKNKISKLID